MTHRTLAHYADTADLTTIAALHAEGLADGITTNPSLMRQAGVSAYLNYARTLCTRFPTLPFSFEVLADDHATMIQQAHALHACGPNVFIKVPVINCEGRSSAPVIQALDRAGIACNITAVYALEQVQGLLKVLSATQAHIVSVFAGRIADSGRDPLPCIRNIRTAIDQAQLSKTQLLWASTRERYNILQAHEEGCDIITVPPAIAPSILGG